jgi:hypothetical protein
MTKLVYPIHSSEIGKVVKALADCMNLGLCLAISLVVVGGNYLELDLKVLHEPLPEV